MNRLSAWMRCLSPRSMRSHSAARHDARNQIEGEDALRAGGVAIDVEGDPHLQQQTFGRMLVAEDCPSRQGDHGVEEQ